MSLRLFIFPSFYFYLNALINMEKLIGLLYANVLFYRKPILPNRAVQNKIIKCTFQVNKDSAYSAVKPWLNIFFFFKFAGNIAVRPLISETLNRNSKVTNKRQAYYFFDFSQLHVDIFRQQCSSLLLHNTTFKSKISIQKLFIIHFGVSRSPFTQTVTLAYYTVCEHKKNVNLKKNYVSGDKKINSVKTGLR